MNDESLRTMRVMRTMKKHSIWITLLLDAYALLCIYLLMLLLGGVSMPAFNLIRG
jgi:hypothetical protein